MKLQYNCSKLQQTILIFSILDHVFVHVCRYTAGICLRIVYSMSWHILALWLDFVAQHKVSSQSEDKKENPQHHEVHVKLCILHVQQLQDFLWLLELTNSARTLQLRPVHAVDREYHPFKAVPETANPNRANSSKDIQNEMITVDSTWHRRGKSSIEGI